MKPLKAIGQIAAVTVEIFIKVFPLSGILFGLLVIFFLASLGGFNDFRTWFQGPKSWWNCVAMALLASLASMFISYCLLRLFRASPFGGPDYSRFSVVHGNGKLLLIPSVCRKPRVRARDLLLTVCSTVWENFAAKPCNSAQRGANPISRNT